MTTFAFDFDHATALSTDLERAAANIREPVPPAVYARQSADFARTEVSPGQHDFFAALERATSTTAAQSRMLARRIQDAADSGFRMVRDAGVVETTTGRDLGALDDVMAGGAPGTADASGNDEVSR